MKVFNLKKLAAIADVEYWTLYYWATDRYENPRIDKPMKTRIANSIVDSLKPFLKKLGFELTIKALKK